MNETISSELSVKRLLRDGLVFNTAIGVLIMGSLAMKPEIWVNDYPPDIKEKYGEQPPEVKKWAYITAVPFFLIMIGGIVWSTLRLKKENGGQLSFQAAFAHVTLLILSCSLLSPLIGWSSPALRVWLVMMIMPFI